MKAGTALILVGLLSLSCAGPGSQTLGAKAAPPAAAENRRLANLRRAAQYPWTDEGGCAAREAAGEWRALVEQCYGALDLSRIQFRDVEHRCPVAQADAMTLRQRSGSACSFNPSWSSEPSS